MSPSKAADPNHPLSFSKEGEESVCLPCEPKESLRDSFHGAVPHGQQGKVISIYGICQIILLCRTPPQSRGSPVSMEI